MTQALQLCDSDKQQRLAWSCRNRHTRLSQSEGPMRSCKTCAEALIPEGQMGLLGRWGAGAAEQRFLDRYRRSIRGVLGTHDPTGPPITLRDTALMHGQAMNYAAHECLASQFASI